MALSKFNIGPMAIPVMNAVRILFDVIDQIINANIRIKVGIAILLMKIW